IPFTRNVAGPPDYTPPARPPSAPPRPAPPPHDPPPPPTAPPRPPHPPPAHPGYAPLPAAAHPRPAARPPPRHDPPAPADPPTGRPVRIMSMARLMPISRGRRTVPPSTSGTPHRRQKTPNVASDAATRKSHHSASSRPPATA